MIKKKIKTFFYILCFNSKNQNISIYWWEYNRIEIEYNRIE